MTKTLLAMNDEITMISFDTGKECGVAIWKGDKVSDVKLFSFDPNKPQSECIQDIVKWTYDMLYNYRPRVAMERPGRFMHVQWMTYSDVRLITDKFRCLFKGFFPTAVKRIVAENGRASKDDMKEAVINSGSVDDKHVSWLDNEHITDAIAVGLCCIKSYGV